MYGVRGSFDTLRCDVLPARTSHQATAATREKVTRSIDRSVIVIIGRAKNKKQKAKQKEGYSTVSRNQQQE